MLKRIVILIIFLILGIIAYSFIVNLKTPTNLGVVNHKFKNLKSTPNGVSTQAIDSKKLVDTIKYEDLEIAMEKVDKRIIELGGEIKKEDSNYIYAVFTSNKMKFKDDVEVYFNENNKEMQFKSESRLGKSDLGVNRKRYEEIIKIF